jgi:hypothetical protein
MPERKRLRMKLVKRCNDNVIALLIILLARYIFFAFQKITFIIGLTPLQKEQQKYQKFTEGPSILKGEAISFTAAD